MVPLANLSVADIQTRSLALADRRGDAAPSLRTTQKRVSQQRPKHGVLCSRPDADACRIPGLDPFGRLLARLSSRSALAADFSLVMERVSSHGAGSFKDAIIANNCLSRGSNSSRAKLYKELKGRYILDDQDPLFAAFLSVWNSAKGGQDRAQLAYVLLALNDRTVAVTSSEWLFPHLRKSGSELRVRDLEAFYRFLGKNGHPEIGKWSAETLQRVAQHYLASVRDFGFATGGSKKIARRPSIESGPVRLILHALHIAGVSPSETINHGIFRVLGIAPGEVVDVLSELNRQGAVKFRMQADVVELSV